MADINRDILLATSIGSLALICLVPVLIDVPGHLDLPIVTRACLMSVALTLPGIVWVLCMKCLFRNRNEALGIGLAVLLLSLVMVDLHYSNVDLGHYFPRGEYEDNVAWQKELQSKVLDLAPNVLPHSYRFLPNGLVRWLELLTGNYLIASLVYRLSFAILTLHSLYYFAGMYGARLVGVLSILFYVIVYPISIRYYAGQLTDPMSHLCFLASYIFILQRRYLPFLTVCLVGVLAKESVLLMPVYYLLFAPGERRLLRGLFALLLCAALAVGVRFFVAGGLEYEKISGVGLGFASLNFLRIWDWGRQFWNTAGLFLPFCLLHWSCSPRDLRKLILFLIPALWCSNLLFSHLRESRNFVPVVFPLAVMAALCCAGWLASDRATQQTRA